MTSAVEHDGTVYYELTDNVWADAPYAIRVEVGRVLTADAAERLAGLVGYAYAKTGGERGNGYVQDSPKSVVYYCDTTKGRAYKHLEQFFEDAKTYIVEGSPQRKTKNMTRLVEGLGDVGEIKFFADNVGGLPDPPPVPENWKNGVDADGFSTWNGFNADGIHVDTGTKYGPHGLDVNGLTKDGSKYGNDGYDASGFDRNGVHMSGVSTSTSPDQLELNLSGEIKPGVYTVKDAHVRVGKNERLSVWKGDKWSPVTTADAKQDTKYRVLNYGSKTPVETLAEMGRASGVCLVCGRHLTDPAAVLRGIGAGCLKKV